MEKLQHEGRERGDTERGVERNWQRLNRLRAAQHRIEQSSKRYADCDDKLEATGAVAQAISGRTETHTVRQATGATGGHPKRQRWQGRVAPKTVAIRQAKVEGSHHSGNARQQRRRSFQRQAGFASAGHEDAQICPMHYRQGRNQGCRAQPQQGAQHRWPHRAHRRQASRQ